MKLITIQVSDEEHKDIKLKATQAGVSIKSYLLGDNSTDLPVASIRNVVNADKAQEKIVTDYYKQGTQLCKIHGTPLTPEGKCLQKGCKYS